MGIRASVRTNKTETLKMYNALSSYLFEQECDELSNVSKSDIATLRSAQSVLGKIL